LQTVAWVAAASSRHRKAHRGLLGVLVRHLTTSHTSGMVYRCRAQTDDGTLCKRRVNGPDVRCFQHRGRPSGRVPAPRKRPAKRVQAPRQIPRERATSQGAAQYQRPPQPATQAARERQRADEAAQLCLNVLENGGTALVVERASAYVADETWKTLVRRHRRTGCDDLAELARNILNGADRLHEAVGRAAGRVFGWLGRPPIERVFAQELARRIPLPVAINSPRRRGACRSRESTSAWLAAAAWPTAPACGTCSGARAPNVSGC
jgi:hypothetical protein